MMMIMMVKLWLSKVISNIKTDPIYLRADEITGDKYFEISVKLRDTTVHFFLCLHGEVLTKIELKSAQFSSIQALMRLSFWLALFKSKIRNLRKVTNWL